MPGGPPDLVSRDLGTAALLLSVAGWVWFALVWDRYGRARRLRDGSGEGPGSLDSALPDDPPAVAAALVRHPSPVDAGILAAVVTDLARRGHLEVHEQPGLDWRFVRRRGGSDDLRGYEKVVLARLFVRSDESTVSELGTWARRNPQQARLLLDRVRRQLDAELEDRGYVERAGRRPAALNGAAVAVVALAGLVALVGGAPVGLLALVSAAGQGVAGRGLRRRTPRGEARAAAWRRLADAWRSCGPEPSGDLALACALALGAGPPSPLNEALRRAVGEPAASPGPTDRLRSWPQTVSALRALGRRGS